MEAVTAARQLCKAETPHWRSQGQQHATLVTRLPMNAVSIVRRLCAQGGAAVANVDRGEYTPLYVGASVATLLSIPDTAVRA